MQAGPRVAVRIFVGGVRPLAASGKLSGIYKLPLAGPVQLGPEGFDGDVQADRRVHGGPDKAVQVYPLRHHGALERQFPQLAGRLGPGAIGENLSCEGLDESGVRVGDVWRLGEALLQVCQPRNPCWKIDEKLDFPGVAAAIAQSRRNGWYCRVLRTGRVTPGDALELVEPGEAAFRLDAMLELLQSEAAEPEALQRLARAPGMARNWARKIEQRIAWLREQGKAGA
jgi:MOSC domain-containing protein YiiM